MEDPIETPAEKTQLSGVDCNCWICRAGRTMDQLQVVLSDAVDENSNLQGELFYLRDVVENVLEDIEGQHGDEDWFRRLSGGIMAVDD